MRTVSPRKSCPACGHANRVTAKVCGQCGHSFVLVGADGIVRKACSTCGHANRLTARVCSQCGHAFTVMRHVRLPGIKKWCPQCGAPRRPAAKVCTQCGFRFKTAPAESPVMPAPRPAVNLPPPPSTPTTLPPMRSRAGIEGEPSPYISNDDLNRLRGAGPYSPGLVGRLAHRLTRKDNS